MPQGCFVTNPNCNDVLLGRGFAKNHLGTQQFHQLCRLHWDEYFSSNKRETKDIVAYRIVNTINDLNPPGRFLEAVSLEIARTNGFEMGKEAVWQEVDIKVALKKIKQTMRDTKPEAKSNSLPFPLCNSGSLQQSQHTSNSRHATTVHAGKYQQQEGETPRIVCNGIKPPSEKKSGVVGEKQGDVLIQASGLDNNFCDSRMKEKRSSPNQEHGLGYDVVETAAANTPGSKQSDLVAQFKDHSAFSADELEASNQLLKLMTMDDARKFTPEDEMKEWEQMTEEEQLAAARDLFGASFPILQTQKRVKRISQEPADMSSLLIETVYELGRIPSNKREALLEALSKADKSEFSNERLEIFLRIEDMHPKRAAERFSTYWTERRKLFGPDKYLLPLTLSAALRDDLKAMCSGAFQLLPKLDSSGRHLMLKEVERDTRNGYTRDGLLRVYWYLTELVSSRNKGRVGEFVVIPYGASSSTFWDFDSILEDRMFELERICLPACMTAFHPIGPPWIMFAIKPIAFAFMDKRTRTRTTIHDTSQIPESLEKFGIHKDMLPTQMGGTIDVDLCKWVEGQKAKEQRREPP